MFFWVPHFTFSAKSGAFLSTIPGRMRPGLRDVLNTATFPCYRFSPETNLQRSPQNDTFV
jgi:hypothetical protein